MAQKPDEAPSAAFEPVPEPVPAPALAPPSALSAQLRSLAAGGFGGICAVIVGHPFDLVKVRLQTAEKGVYSSAVDVVRKSIARDGLRRGLYAGVSAPLLGVTPMFAVSFWGYDVGKTLVRSISAANPDGSLTIGQISAAGFFSAIPMTVITAPFERVKVILQVQGQQQLAPGEKPRYSGSLDVVRHLYRDGGIRSVFRGSAATLARDGPGSAAYFAAYEYIKHALTPKDPATGQPAKDGKLSLTAITVAGGGAGIAMWIPVFPVDTVKSRLQTSTEPGITVGSVVRDLGTARAACAPFSPASVRHWPVLCRPTRPPSWASSWPIKP
ncbi:carnitine acyl carrier [Grosmannia clavigera kw1407]|uniref:Carnitine acyl carrier n=1 Tax=Grosmannia clavigera (strain kw1407 / UAMH 11150) TaxID=655863 RepID=F0X863_GROCL|nr:carnitine acyl carrier [Grosmannia clavigera kw1407]EFX05720.1 carnitine acyl carrier [Grosmannia clavigera kw1407]